MEFEYDLSVAMSSLLHIGVAYLLALPVGWNREAEARSAGLRTFPLVAVGSCGYVLLGTQVAGDADGLARILYGLMTGIGFIGGGAILKNRGMVSGTATAASIWITGSVGAAVAIGRYEIASVLSLLTFFTLRWIRPLKSIARASGTAKSEEDLIENS